MAIITVEKPLKDKLGDEGVDSLIRLLNQSQQNQKQDLMVYLEEKYERRLGEEIGAINVTIAEAEKRLDNRITEEIGAINVTIAETEKRLDNRITEEIGKVNERLTEEIGKVNERITEEIAGVKVEISNVRSDGSKNHADLIKWMFIFWMGQVIALVGILFAFFK